MKTVQILENDDILQDGDLYRPMYKTNFPAYLWNDIPSSWVGHKVEYILAGAMTFEFIRGPVPKSHCLDASRRAGGEKGDDYEGPPLNLPFLPPLRGRSTL